ncbi:MAG: tRNA (N6-isopentenyl adenosine(37)-C2)-methylthiotransferase MiaB [Parvibaculales bacterium]
MKSGDFAKAAFIKNYGCQMNVYDAERMASILQAEGYVMVERAEEAGLVILNTCHIREKAAEKVYSDIGRFVKRCKPRPMIGVVGCVAQAEGEEMRRRQPHIDFVMGPQSYHKLGAMVKGVRGGSADRVMVEFLVEEKFAALKRLAPLQKRACQILTIQEGCDKFCSFCVVPYTRGAEVSRPMGEVLLEAEKLLDAGAVEITLLGQNVNGWRCGVHDFASLLTRLCESRKLKRLRYSTSHPCDMTESLIRAHGELEVLMPHLHLPAQSGSDRILTAMNRRHSRKEYVGIIEALRGVRPDIALSSDFIVGFPSETEEDFEETLSLVREIGFAQAYSFKYSPRPGTPAEGREQVAESVKAERLARLQEQLGADQLAFNRETETRAMPILWEKRGKVEGQLVGRSPYMQAVHAMRPESYIGEIETMSIAEAQPRSLKALPLAQKARKPHSEKMNPALERV